MRAAGADSAGCRSLLVERPVVDGPCDREQPRGIAFMDRFGLHRREMRAVERLREQVVHQQSLHRCDDVADVA